MGEVIAAGAVSQRGPRRALVVDDSAAARQELAGLLEPHGLEVVQVENGGEALRALQTQHFDVVFLDLEMPVLDGTSLFRLLRARGDHVPVVLITSTSDMRRLVVAVKLGARDYLPKPFDGKAVGAAVDRVLGAVPGEPAVGDRAEASAES